MGLTRAGRRDWRLCEGDQRWQRPAEGEPEKTAALVPEFGEEEKKFNKKITDVHITYSHTVRSIHLNVSKNVLATRLSSNQAIFFLYLVELEQV